ncbi:redoxin domain-containing protein [Candidatus Sulfidibacterium hydrothermale]|uniref:thioredoxin family protein n=1 Tax=Candidatus Sulfidibacterium hydrothermale TaxID=2875962 RepID=UPI001F0AE252|nr:thioredoxin domain-containing protein [Candidatus Sulfidibacterium hydrothermale]UBM61672.1 redoxin domain-containing protein [Candidatus Sulfidibacterium hydrothermale]
MKKIIPLLVLIIGIVFSGCTSIKGNQEKDSATIVKDSSNNVQVVPEHLTYATFIKKIWNFEKHPQQWVYEGDGPCVIDFYADWCGPCRRVAPIMQEMANKYKGKVTIYKVNVDKENKLASILGIQNIPAVLFIPKTGKPMMQVGSLPRDTYVQIINEQLLHIKPKAKK